MAERLTPYFVVVPTVFVYSGSHSGLLNGPLDSCVMDWTQDEATMELTARLQVISVGHQKRDRG